MRYLIIFLLSFSTWHLLAQPSKDFEMEILIQCTPIENQQMSGTCWSFASTSFLESELLRMGKGKVNLSEMYFAYYSYLSKIEQHLATQGQSFFTAGGQFHDVMRVIKKYGIVPQDAYKGQSLFQGHYHPPLDSIMQAYTMNLLKNNKKTLTASDEDFAKTVLNTFLGTPPITFYHQEKQYTPQNFLKEGLGFDTDNYIEITSVTSQPFYTKFVLEDKYNWTKDMYYNVPLEDFVAITNEALKKGYTVLWDGDAVEPTFKAEEGYAYLADTTVVNQQTRQRDINNKNTQIEHVMHIVGLAKDKTKENITKKNKKVKEQAKHWYYIKNSWGEISKFHGFLYMSEEYFKMKTVAIVVHKDAIPLTIRKKMKL
ncbi:MAG: hypothetical protein MUC49_09685 [Raineya sp.]|jgi:bleomycin hydrolase|nr:hypothetical protein [Raineya sp.]